MSSFKLVACFGMIKLNILPGSLFGGIQYNFDWDHTVDLYILHAHPDDNQHIFRRFVNVHLDSFKWHTEQTVTS